jgi:hypothetical protein
MGALEAAPKHALSPRTLTHATQGARSYVPHYAARSRRRGDRIGARNCSFGTRNSARWEMTAEGQSRHLGRRPTISGLPLETDIVTVGRHVSKVPSTEVRRMVRLDSTRPMHSAVPYLWGRRIRSSSDTDTPLSFLMRAIRLPTPAAEWKAPPPTRPVVLAQPTPTSWATARKT